MGKGISPIISAIVLIAATMSVAGAIAYWAANFVGMNSPETASAVSSMPTKCQSADFQIYQCSYSASSQIISFVLYNERTIDLGGMTATVFDANSLPAWSNVTLVPISPAGVVSNILPVGQYFGYQISNIPSTFSKIIISTSMCPSITHETTCRS
jgi:flagellin-like protein